MYEILLFAQGPDYSKYLNSTVSRGLTSKTTVLNNKFNRSMNHLLNKIILTYKIKKDT